MSELESYKKEVLHRESLIKEALSLWYNIIGQDHHKDRDCHFYIQKNYSTYLESTWNVYHNGYILKDYSQDFPTFELALQGLLDLLLENIAKEISVILENFEELVKVGEKKKDDKDIILNYRKRLEILVMRQYYDIEKTIN
jgi:hypothetical protein